MDGLSAQDAFGERLAQAALDMYTIPYGTPKDAGELPAVRAKHPSWSIGCDRNTGVWIAVRKPSPSRVEVHAAYALVQLDAKLDAEGTAS